MRRPTTAQGERDATKFRLRRMPEGHPTGRDVDMRPRFSL
jgi:hypothetical protein